jgi:hypothetical protein
MLTTYYHPSVDHITSYILRSIVKNIPSYEVTTHEQDEDVARHRVEGKDQSLTSSSAATGILSTTMCGASTTGEARLSFEAEDLQSVFDELLILLFSLFCEWLSGSRGTVAIHGIHRHHRHHRTASSTSTRVGGLGDHRWNSSKRAAVRAVVTKAINRNERPVVRFTLVIQESGFYYLIESIYR